jgi:hypothetical protein
MQDNTAVEKIVTEFEQLSFEQQREFLKRIEIGRAGNERAKQAVPPTEIETPDRKDRLKERPPFTPKITGIGAPVRDRSREYDWLGQHRDEYANQWVALDDDHLVSYGTDFKLVIDEARRQGRPDALMIFVEPSTAPLSISRRKRA